MHETLIAYEKVWSEKLEADKREIEEVCFNIFNSDYSDGVQSSNIGGFQSHSVHLLPEYKSLVDQIEDKAKILISEFEIIDKVEPYIVNMWFNYNVPGSINLVHAHITESANSNVLNPIIWSGTYYVKVPENSGNLFFTKHNPDAFTDIKSTKIPSVFLKNEFNKNLQTIREITPEEGRVYFWLSDMWHGVTENKSQNDRLSISFNIGLRMR